MIFPVKTFCINVIGCIVIGAITVLAAKLSVPPRMILFLKVGVCGGFTGAKKIAAVAEAHHVSLVPHNPLSPVMTNAVLNFAAATDNVAICEYPNPYAASTADHLTVSGVKLRQCDMVDHIPEMKNGYLPVPKEDGIGIELIPDLEERFPFRPHKILTRLNLDGSICDQ